MPLWSTSRLCKHNLQFGDLTGRLLVPTFRSCDANTDAAADADALEDVGVVGDADTDADTLEDVVAPEAVVREAVVCKAVAPKTVVPEALATFAE